MRTRTLAIYAVLFGNIGGIFLLMYYQEHAKLFLLLSITEYVVGVILGYLFVTQHQKESFERLYEKRYANQKQKVLSGSKSVRLQKNV